MNKFEHVFHRGHQMSIAGGRTRARGSLYKGMGSGGPCTEGVVGPCMVRSNAFWVVATRDLSPPLWIDMTEKHTSQNFVG